MKQILQDIKNGKLTVREVPSPLVQPSEVLIANVASLVSAGTERSTRELAKKSLLGKALARPDQVRKILQKVRSEGLKSTYQKVKSQLDLPMTMGYSAAGVVLACGRDVQEFKPGDRVASNGSHAEAVAVSRNLCARIPEGVDFDQAAFTVLGAIAMQGVRLAKVNLGETVLVVGLGLVGQLTVGILKAAGCRVLATDLDASRCELALTMGAEVASTRLETTEIKNLTSGLGVDAVLLTAATDSNGPIELAAAAVRRKGRVVLVGVVGLQLDRRPFYFKEAEFVVSCSYGPGRYEYNYEQLGRDYPAEYVRWTEQRNLTAVLQLMASGQLNVAPLISHRFAIKDAEQAYQLVDSNSEPFMGILFEYPDWQTAEPTSSVTLSARPAHGKVGYGVLGTGNFARGVLLPHIQKHEQLAPVAICSARGTTASLTGEKLGFAVATSDEDQVFSDPNISVIFSITPHHEHAQHVVKAIENRKSIFIEKPLCLKLEDLAEIDAALTAAGSEAPLLMVGFNRRFSAAAIAAKQLFADVSAPKTISIRFNAGQLPPEHWTQIDEVGGGRIIGEACHAIDLATFLAGSLPVRVFAESVGGEQRPEISDDQCFITLRHANGSVSSIAYLAGGDGSLAKERVEIFGGGRAAIIDDFRSVKTHQNGKSKKRDCRGQDKGHAAEIDAFAKAVTHGGSAPISWAEIRATSLAAILAVQSIREGGPIDLG